MVRKKSSCLKKLVLGCGGLVLCFVLLGFALFISASLNKPKPADQQKLSVSESFGGNAETSLNLPEGSPNYGKPVKLVLELSMLNFDLVPNTASKEIGIESDYDVANFELETKVDEKDDYIIYKITFKNKRTLLGMLLQGGINDQDIQNRVKVMIPKDLLVDINFQMSMGEADLDLTGLAISDINAQFSMGEFEIQANEPNQVPMGKLRIQTSMGETRINDFQNLRFVNGDFQGSMGEVRFRNSGDLIDPASLSLKMSMGEFNIDVPPNANLKARSRASFGEIQERGEKLDNPDGPEFKVQSNVTFGSVQLNRSYSRSPLSGRMLRTIRAQGLEAAVADYHELKANRSAYFDFRPSSLNSVGYALLRDGLFTEAITIFKLNIEVHPTYANGYDSLGEAYMKAGQREEAIVNYRKSLELDPSNDNALEMLAILGEEQQLDPNQEPIPDPPEPPKEDN